jgi:NAD kinase
MNTQFEKIILVTRQTRLEELIARFNTKAQARFYIEHSGGNFALYEREHEVYETAVSHLRRALQKLSRLQVIERQFLPNFLFSQSDLIVTIGIDGLVVNTAKYLDGQPLIAVNPDPDHIDGVLLPFTVSQAPAIVAQALQGEMQVQPISMAEARLNDGQSLLAFNDLFIGRHDHVSARYRLQFQGQAEAHSSSGIIVSTGAGSTGWLSSLFNMANGMLATFDEQASPLARPVLPWEAENLLFVVREPFASQTSAASIVCGAITAESPLRLESNMPDGGVIFSDGVTADFLSFNAGTTATIGLAARKTNLVIGER